LGSLGGHRPVGSKLLGLAGPDQPSVIRNQLPDDTLLVFLSDMLRMEDASGDGDGVAATITRRIVTATGCNEATARPRRRRAGSG
jgi:hypothetical protein